MSVMSDTPSIAVTIAPTPVLSVEIQGTSSLDVSVLQRGPKGDTGPAATAGSVDGINIYQQIPLQVWTIAHNLGYVPVVQIYDDAGDLCDANVVADASSVTITAAGPFSGRARLI